MIGSDAALKDLVAKKGTPTSGYYERNREAIHCHFRPSTFTLDLARVLHAPTEQVHPNIRLIMNQHSTNQDGSNQDEAISFEQEDYDLENLSDHEDL